MRGKTAIARLAGQAPSIEWPARPNPRVWARQTWLANLRSVLAENDVGGEWEWDEDSQRLAAEWSWSWSNYDTLSASVGPGLSREERLKRGLSCTFRRNATLDPRAPLAEEIQRLINEREQFRADCQAAARAITKETLS